MKSDTCVICNEPVPCIHMKRVHTTDVKWHEFSFVVGQPLTTEGFKMNDECEVCGRGAECSARNPVVKTINQFEATLEYIHTLHTYPESLKYKMTPKVFIHNLNERGIEVKGLI